MREHRLLDQVAAALLWIAAFCYACGVFLCLTLLFRNLPPTAPVAVGVVTVEHASKLRDYVDAALFFLLVPPLAVWFAAIGARADAHFRRSVRPAHRTLASVCLTVPFFFSPALFLTTGKVGWVLVLPLAVAWAGPRLVAFADGTLWVRRLLRREMRPYFALIVAAALSWIFFRYLVVWKRIAHIPTLFLELVFAGLFLALFIAVAVYIALLAKLLFGAVLETSLRRVAVGAPVLVVLPLFALVQVPVPHPAAAVAVALLTAALIAVAARRPLASGSAWKLAAWVIFPLLIYCVSYASTAQLSQWIDLFHRGESIGPASDYLRGKVPYRDVFVLHGMLEDGQLDAWLMQIFGRSVSVSVAQTVVLGGFLALSLWYLGLVLFESIPLALLVVAMGAWTTAENNRTFFAVGAVACFWYGLKRDRSAGLFAAGIFSGLALFFSYEIGLYSIAGGIVALLLLPLASRGPSPVRTRASWLRAGIMFLLGVAAASAPFLIWLASHGAAGAFFETSFVTIPRIIDAVWSLPFPDLVSTFRHDLSLRSLADFILLEKFHLIVTPLAIAVAGAYCIRRRVVLQFDRTDQALLVVTVFAALAQRTAFGRAEFRHQYFAAFLLGPILVLLAVILTRHLRGIWRAAEGGGRAFVVAVIVAAIPALTVLFWVPDLLNARIDDFRLYQLRVLHIFRDGAAEAVTARIHDIVGEVDSLTRPGEPIFDFSNQPALYFFADRPNPTRFYQVPILSPPEFQAETIRALERARPKIVLRRSPENFDNFDGVPNAVRAQAVAAYIDDCYAFYRNARGVEIWRRRPHAVPAPLAAYLRRIALPRSSDLLNPGFGREVFPVIGNSSGIGGAYWVSDLTMLNPLRQPVSVRLRYITSGRAIDRSVRLGAMQTLRADDVVRSWFHAPGTIGSLWIEFVNGRTPVVVVHSWDAAHGRHGSIERPLTASDAATAGGTTPELAVVGIPAPSAEGRRINIGVVNVGDFPATFRITAQTAAGVVAGRPIESGVAEDGVWVTADLEKELGVPIGEAMTVRVTAIAGSGVAYASVVQPNGDVLNIAGVPAQAK
ncbi:MAG TPA: hypothetical protein VKH35_17310 [Thermoanaerobaculia bacterium]|nr:hypothetical protein [Thermoanaerobaculia bacterium]